MKDTNRPQAIRTYRETKADIRKRHLQKYQFIEGVAKPCLNCGCSFIPTTIPAQDKKKRFHDKTAYATSLFCKIECEMNYIREALNHNAAPRGVSQQLNKGDMNKGVSMTQGAKWREAKKNREK